MVVPLRAVAHSFRHLMGSLAATGSLAVVRKNLIKIRLNYALHADVNTHVSDVSLSRLHIEVLDYNEAHMFRS